MHKTRDNLLMAGALGIILILFIFIWNFNYNKVDTVYNECSNSDICSIDIK